VHGVVPIETAKRIERAIHVVDTIVLKLEKVAIRDLIFGHGLGSCARLIGEVACVAAPVIHST